MYLNKAIIFGNLTRDPELKSLPSGAKVCQFSLATNRVWKDQAGAKKESAEFHNIVLFGKQAELVAQYLRKGSSALVEGRMQTRSWDAQDGTKKYRTEIVGEKIQFGPKASNTGGAGTYQASGTSTPSKPEKSDETDTIEYPEEDINTEDIPF